VAVSILDRPVYSEAEAARLLGVAQSTLNYWLEGGERRGKHYKPIIRVEPKGTRSVAWAEFVEAAFLRGYRKDHKVPMLELRAFIDELRDELGVPYPLAHEQPWVAGKNLVVQAQERSQLSPEYWLFAPARGQLLLSYPAEMFLERVTFEDEVASSWRPNPPSPVLISPEVRFGQPSINGVSTEALWEQGKSGLEVEELAHVYQLQVTDVWWALAYEDEQRARAGQRAA
jgi:uncharacterized protein (DUF433 family)